jgi:hypothetical protein
VYIKFNVRQIQGIQTLNKCPASVELYRYLFYGIIKQYTIMICKHIITHV